MRLSLEQTATINANGFTDYCLIPHGAELIANAMAIQIHGVPPLQAQFNGLKGYMVEGRAICSSKQLI